MSDSILARYAECLYWMARYVERADNLARIIDVHETFTRDRTGQQNWMPVVQLYADEDRFLDAHPGATPARVIHFYVLDGTNPSSIASSVRMARENARTMRPLISTEMWTQLNVFYNRIRELSPADVTVANLPRLCSMVKEACQTHTGITEGTFYRDQGWYFYQLGRAIERADQTTRQLDIKYHYLLSKPGDVGTPVDTAQWNAMLRSVAGYHAFRRVHPRGLDPGKVAGFMLLNNSFPRSVMLCVRQADALLTRVKSRYNLPGGEEAQAQLAALQTALTEHRIEDVIERGLHQYLDWVQQRLMASSMEIARSFFGADLPSQGVPATPWASNGIGMTQTQSAGGQSQSLGG